jgi:hypothetical protein
MEKAQPFDPLQKPLIVLVVGECGDGKSSLIRHFYESTPKGTQLKIMHHFNANLELPDPPGVGASTSGVTKRATAYPVLIGTRSVILIDSPGVGDSDIKPEQILAGLMKELESDVLNAVLLCTAMPKKRLTMGQKFCTDLIDRAIDEECKWENFILVGTQKDLYYPGKTKEKQSAKWERWRTDMLATMTERCDGKVTKSALVCINAVDSDSDSDSEDEGSKADVSELAAALQQFELQSTLTCREVSDEELVAIMNEALQDTVVTQAALKVCRDSRTLQGAAEMTYTVGQILAPVAAIEVVGFGGGAAASVGMACALEIIAPVAMGTEVGLAAMACTGGIVAAGALGLLGGAYIGGTLYSQFAGNNDTPTMRASFYDTLRSMIPASIQLSPMQSVQMKSSPEIDLSGALSSMIYCVQSKADLDAQLQDHFGTRPEMLVFSTVIYGKKDKFYQPAAVVVHGRTMFIAWRGTQTLLDMITDINCTPQVAPLWHELCPEIKVHNGMYGMIQTYFHEQLEKMQAIAADHKVRKIIFTGHSLGGGLAQIALLSMFGQLHTKFSEYKPSATKLQEKSAPELKGALYKLFRRIECSAIVFAAPMVFHVPAVKSLQPATQATLKLLQNQCANFVFDDDVVPRFPGHITFWKAAMAEIAAQKVETSARRWFTETGNASLDGVPEDSELDPVAKAVASLGITGAALIFGGLVDDFVRTKVLSKIGSLDDSVVSMMSEYQHTSTIIHFDFKGDGKITQQVLTPEKFALKSLRFLNRELSRKYLLEFHSVCPGTMGEAMHKKQEAHLQKLRKSLSTECQEAMIKRPDEYNEW